MAKQKFGKKDIFAPTTKMEEETKKTKELLEKPVNLKKPKRRPKRKVVKRPALAEPPKPIMIIHSFRMREDLVNRLKEYAFFEKAKMYKIINVAVEDFLKGYKPKRHLRSS